MAEGLLNALYRDSYQAYSAGIFTSEVNPYAVEVMKEIGIDISFQYSKSIEDFKNKKFDVVATVCDNAKKACPFFPGKKIIHKSFEDPSGFTGSIEDTIKEFMRVRDQIKQWIQENFSEKDS
jgi:arsenate reductase